MLIDFRVKNYKSFKNEAGFSMVASSIKENPQNVFTVNKTSLLKSAVVYGANASGKTNLIDSMFFMRQFVINSSKESQQNEKIDVSRFRLSVSSEKLPAQFEVTFLYEDIRYRYGFAVDEEKVCAEWLYYVPKKIEVPVFFREEQRFDLKRHFKTEEPLVKGDRIRPNALLLSVSAQFNGKIASKVLEWFRSVACLSGLHDFQYQGYTCEKISEDNIAKGKVLSFLKRADMGIDDLSVRKEQVPESALPAHFRNKKEAAYQHVIDVFHRKFDDDGNVVGSVCFDLDRDESSGTNKFFSLSGPFIDALENGLVFFVDELDSKLHPHLIDAICELFNSEEHNPKNAQIVFVSHNTNLISRGILRRDQIWFTEKDRCGATDLYSLVEFKKAGKKVRNDASYEKDYLRGKYGAVPAIRDLGAAYGE